MKKIFMFATLLIFSAVVFYPALAAPQKIQAKNIEGRETPLSCQVVSTFLNWSLNHRPEYYKIADFDGNGVINLGDLVMFAQNKFNDEWCADRLGWHGDKTEVIAR